MPNFHLTSLLLVEERLLEADYFARRLRLRNVDHLGYELNAFLAAARSVTFILQKEMQRVPGFSDWWNAQRRILADDAAAAFFLKLRNFSQKEGRISVVGVQRHISRQGKAGQWTYRFAGNIDPVPPVLLNRDLTDCCREHVAKLSKIVLACTESFPFRTCPRRALTPEGVEVLGLSLHDVEEILGFPRGWSEAGDVICDGRRIDILREYVDGLDFAALHRLARWKPARGRIPATPSSSLSDKILTALVDQLEGRHQVSAAQFAGSLLLDDEVD